MVMLWVWRSILNLLITVRIKREIERLSIFVLHLILYDSIHITILEVRADQIHVNIIRNVIPCTVIHRWLRT